MQLWAICRKWVEAYQGTERFTHGHTDVMPQPGTDIQCPEPLAPLPSTSALPHPILPKGRCHPAGAKGRQRPGCQSHLPAVPSHGSACTAPSPAGYHGQWTELPLEQDWGKKSRGGLTLFRIFLPTSTTTYSITLSIQLRPTSRWMMEHSRPFSALRMIADGPVLHHSDENPWVQRYFISLQHVSAFSLPMMTIQ